MIMKVWSFWFKDKFVKCEKLIKFFRVFWKKRKLIYFGYLWKEKIRSEENDDSNKTFLSREEIKDFSSVISQIFLPLKLENSPKQKRSFPCIFLTAKLNENAIFWLSTGKKWYLVQKQVFNFVCVKIKYLCWSWNIKFLSKVFWTAAPWRWPPQIMSLGYFFLLELWKINSNSRFFLNPREPKTDGVNFLQWKEMKKNSNFAYSSKFWK